jgi:hypothetical protein
MSKFLLNLLVQISKAFVYSKIQILFGNHFSSDYGPSGPALSSPAASPQAAVCALGPLGLSSLGVFAKRRLFFKFAQSINGVSSHVTAKWAPTVRSSPFLMPSGPPKARLHRASPQLIALRLPASWGTA